MAQRVPIDPWYRLALNLGALAIVGGLCHAAERPIRWAAGGSARMAQIAHLVRIRATPESVFRRVASTEGIAEWFTQASSPDYREGGTLELRFGDEPVSFTITELTVPSRIVWHCTTKENSWFNTDITFEFAAEGDRTVVRFDHLGWPEVTDRFRDCSTSWAYFLESLRSLLEEGRGTPESVAPACEGSTAA